MSRLRIASIRAAVLVAAGLGVLFAQSTTAPAPVSGTPVAPAPVSAGTPPPATIAGTVLYTKPSMANTFGAANPTLTFVQAASNGLIYQQGSTGKFALRTGPGLTYQQNGHWYPTQLQVASASDGSGWLLAGTSIDAKLNGGSSSNESLALTYNSSVFTLQTPKLAYGGQDTFTFEENGTQWTLRVSEYKISIQTTVAARQGKSGGTHSFGFTAPTSDTLSTDKNGHFHVGQDVTVTHALVLGADQKLYNICSPWATDTQNASFTCDDSSLPEKAFPYVIDPDFETGPYWTDFNIFWEEQTSGSGQQQTDNPDSTAVFQISVAGGFDGVTWDTSSFSYSWQATNGSPQCNYSGGSGSVAYPYAYWSLNNSMVWYEDGTEYACTGSSNNSIYAVVWYEAESVSTPSTPSGPTSGFPSSGYSYTYTTGGSTDSYGGAVQYLFNWGDGSNSGWLAQGVTSASHSWSAAGAYYVTAEARSASTQVTSGTSGSMSVTLAWPTTTITTSPANLTITVDGTNYTAPHTFNWTIGSSHSITVPQTQSAGTGKQYVFYSWSDGGALSHSISGPSSAQTYTASFSTQYQLTTAVGAAGGGSISASPSGGWYTSGASVTVTATPSSGYTFAGFSGGLSGTTTPQSVTMNSAVSVTATFTVQPTGFQYGRSITIPYSQVANASQTNFPVLVSLTMPSLMTVANGGHVTSPNGYDICFYADPAGSTPLSWEMESYNGATGSVVAWVKIPTLSHTANTVFYMFYGNSAITAFQSTASSAWDSNFVGVWHLPNGSTLSTSDSTANGFNGTPQNSPTAVVGQIGGGAGLNGSNQDISIGTSSTLSPAAITLSTWIKPTSLPSTGNLYGILDKRDDINGTGGYAVELYNNAGTQEIAVFTAGNSGASVANSLSTSSWSHLVITQSGGTCTVFVNGAQVGSGSANAVTNFSAPLLFGSRQGSNYFNGSLDEVRISNTARSANWIATEYNNQSSPSTFYTVGAEDSPAVGEGSGFTISLTSGSATAIQGGGATYTVTVNGTNGFAGTVSFSTSGLPSGGTAQFSPATVTGSGSTTMTVYSTSNGSFSVTGTAGSDSSTQSASITVDSSAPYTPYQTDSLTSINTSYWSTNSLPYGTPVTSSNGLTSGAVISTVALPTGNDYDERVTVSNCNNGSITLFGRSNADTSTSYWLTLDTANTPTTLALGKKISNSWTTIASYNVTCTVGMTLRMVIRGATIMVWEGPYVNSYTDTSISSGQPGVGVYGPSIAATNVQFGPIDSTAPPAPDQAALFDTAAPYWIDLQWPAGTDNPGGIGLAGYNVYRDNVLLGQTTTPQWRDETVLPNTTHSYSVYAFDQHGNVSVPATISSLTTQSATQPDEQRIGVRSTGAYWGGAGEQIDMLSGNLNFTLPLFKPMARSGWSATFALSYNSQMWRQGNNQKATWLLGEDVGYGLGWKLLAASIKPIWFNGAVQLYVYTDSTGADYRLDQNVGGVWSSLQGTYVVYDTTVSPSVLRFPDGSFWQMGVESSGAEQDAGTLYPSVMEDTNGNQILLTYGSAIGWGTTINTSARITGIADSRGTGNNTYTLSYTYTLTGIPHLTGIAGPSGTNENYTVATGSAAIQDPFAHASFGNINVLNQITATGMNTYNVFTYDSSGEMIKFTTPLGGAIGWSYNESTYSNTTTDRQYMEVTGRSLQASYGATAYNWTVWHGADTNGLHSIGMVQDVTANSQKIWTFNTSTSALASNTVYPDELMGQLIQYQELATGGAATLQKNFTPVQSSGGQPYFGTVLTTLSPGTGQAQTQTVQTLDTHGNLTQSQVFDYGSLTTPARTYNFSYLTGSNYPHIFNRLTSATVTPNGGSAVTLVTNSYDDSPTPLCSGIQGLTASSASGLIDTNYGTGFAYRGNVTQTTGVNTTDITCYAYDTTGIMDQTVNATGLAVSVSTQSDSNYSLPGIVTPNSDSNMATSVSYASSFAVTSVTAGNGASSTTTYDSAGRPLTSTIPDGAQTNYSYVYYSDSGNTSYVNTQTATFVNPPSGAPQRWKVTTLDGFGRAIQVDSGSGTVSLANTVSRVLTQYAPCACSPLLKLWRTSLPFNPNSGSPVWTTYTYDASGRTTAVTAPDGVSQTTYSYNGNSTTVTDPAGKWKTQTKDAFGNLTQVTEPNPAGGSNLATNYCYSPLNQLVGVSMTRGSTTQTRTFAYNGQDMVSATNPENGTVTYTYDASHRVLTRTDAKSQQTQYTYNALGQLTQVTHGTLSGSTFTADNTSTVNYAYDAYGRTSQVQFGAADLNYARTFTYNYTYSASNRILTQTMGWNMATTAGGGSPVNESYSMTYQWDNEGKMTSYNDLTGQAYNYAYDGMGRATNLNACTQYDGSGNCITGDNVFSATAAYGPANQINSLSYLVGTTGSVNESRSYNSLNQLTQLVTTGTRTMNMTYNYPTPNNGRISSSVDAISSQTVNYTYDSLNRLTAAQATGGWGEAYVYDGFGNLEAINQTATGGEQWSATINEATNRLQGVNYDANGNQIGDQVYTNYVWNVENRMVQQLTAGTGGAWYGGTSYSYDPSGRRVMKNVNADPQGTVTGSGYGVGTWEFYFYGLNGRKMATVDCAYNSGYLELCQVTASSTYFAGKLVNEGGDGPVATDRLGSVRSNNFTGGANIQYFPYGAEQTATQEGLAKFGTYTRDAVGQDYAEQRYYNAGMGRFWSPDRTAGNTASPASLNKYAYVIGDPVNYGDRRGLFEEAPDVPGGSAEYCIINPDYCEAYDSGCGGDDIMGFAENPDPSSCYTPDPRPAPATPTCDSAYGGLSGSETTIVERLMNENSFGIVGDSLSLVAEDIWIMSAIYNRISTPGYNQPRNSSGQPVADNVTNQALYANGPGRPTSMSQGISLYTQALVSPLGSPYCDDLAYAELAMNFVLNNGPVNTQVLNWFGVFGGNTPPPFYGSPLLTINDTAFFGNAYSKKKKLH